MVATCTDKSLEERTCLLDKKLAIMSQGNLSGSSLTDCARFVLQFISFEENTKNRESSKQANFKSVFKSYTNRNLQFEETESM